MTEVRQLRPPLGWFHAVKTRDGQARERDGAPIFLANELEAADVSVFEVQFADGLWMLAAPDDITWATSAAGR